MPGPEPSGSGIAQDAMGIAGAFPNPFSMAERAVKLLERINARGELDHKLWQRVEAALEAGVAQRDSWRSIQVRYAAGSGSQEIELSNAHNITHFHISTVPTAGAGRFYISLHEPLMLQAGVVAPTWDYVGTLGGESLTFPVPQGMPRVHIFATAEFEGTLYVATSKAILPS